MKMETNKQTKPGVAILIPDKIDFKTKTILRETKKDPAILFLGIYPKKPKILS